MRRVLLSSIVLLCTALAVFAYETIIIKYPPGEKWNKAYYRKVGNEAILQYVPNGQSQENWTRTIIVHSYFDVNYPIRYFMDTEIARMKKNNPNGNYRFLKLNDNDGMATRCTEDYKNVKAQCEFFKVTRAHQGIITLHYINRDKEDFKENYELWYDIIRKTVYYNSYYRDERTFDKAEYFELW